MLFVNCYCLNENFLSVFFFSFHRSVTESCVAMKTMGWIARAPKPDECPTGHRYLRSPICATSYLGGPLSLANWARPNLCTIKCLAHRSCSGNGKYNFVTMRPLPPLTPIEWQYGYQRLQEYPNLHGSQKWRLVSIYQLIFNV